MVRDLFPDEKIQGLEQEVKKLRTDKAILLRECRKMHKIYKAVWPVVDTVCANGDFLLKSETKEFFWILDAIREYDDDKDLRQRY